MIAWSCDFSPLVSSESWRYFGNLEPLKPRPPIRDRQHCPARPSPIPPTIAPTAEPSAFSPASPPAAQASRPKDAPSFSTSPRRLSPTDQPDFPPSPTASRMYSQRPLSRVPSQTSALPARARNARSLPNSRPYLIDRRVRAATGPSKDVLRGLGAAPQVLYGVRRAGGLEKTPSR